MLFSSVRLSTQDRGEFLDEGVVAVVQALDVVGITVVSDNRRDGRKQAHRGGYEGLGDTRRDVGERVDLFLAVVADLVSSREAEIDFVDMRYSNGFTIGWNNGSRTPVDDTEEGTDEMLALRGDR